MQRKYFVLNLIIILALSLAASFFISTKVYYNQWQDMMLKIERLLEDRRFNIIEDLEESQPLTESMTYNLNNQIFLVAQEKNQTGGDLLNQSYSQSDIQAYAVVVSNDGWLVVGQTMPNIHNLVVINDQNEIIPVTEVVFDLVLGISYLKIEETNLDPIAIINSSNLEIGDLVYGIKPDPHNYQHEIITNSIQNLDTRSIQNRADLIYHPGDIIYNLLNNSMDNSLPVVNNKSQFIGFSINFAGQSYFLPSKYIRYSLNSLFNEDHQISYPSLGINYLDLSEVILNSELPNKGVYVYSVLNYPSPLQKGDIITKVENDEINEIRSLNDILLDYKIGSEVSLSLIRNRVEKEIKLIIKALNE